MQTRLQIGRISTFLFRATAIREDAKPAFCALGEATLLLAGSPSRCVRVDRVVAADA
jgi:hypothetical protein